MWVRVDPAAGGGGSLDQISATLGEATRLVDERPATAIALVGDVLRRLHERAAAEQP